MFKQSNKLLNVLICITMILSIVMSVSTVSYADTKTVLNSKIIVSMGDSYSAGEGIPKFYGQDGTADEKVNNQDWLAHRSTKSWPGMLTLPAVEDSTKAMSECRDKNWYFVAASGAETVDINGRQDKKYDYGGNTGTEYLDRQIDVFRQLGDKKADYVTLTIGGNDADFSEIVECAAIPHPFNPSALSDKINTVWDEYYKPGGIRDNIRKAYSDISYAAGPDAKIIVAGYPRLLNEEGSGCLFSKDDAAIINTAVSNFNKEIETLVNSCKAEGMKICFVSVEDAFAGKEAYCDDEHINPVKPITSQDLDQSPAVPISAYSIHPNEKGAELYRQCVQEKINQIEEDGGRSEWPEMVGSEERDAVLVLDVSGSMNGNPIEETKTAAERFTNTILYEDVGVGIVSYDSSAMKLSDFSKNENYLKNIINRLSTGGSTNIEAGLMQAQQMIENESVAKKKFIVLMSDGEPNVGKCGDELVEYANELKEKGIRIYTLGFFNSVSNKTAAQSLMEKIASEGCHFEVDDATQLMFFFEDIAEQIKGTKYHYIRIACPVDVTVEYNGETLSSEDAEKTQRTSFGTLTFEENPDENESSSDNRIKVLRLKEGVKYDIHIDGNGKGKMEYTVGFMDENGEYSDMRKFTNVKITKKTEIDTVVTNNSDSTILRVDEDGDGKYDLIYKADKNGKGKIVDYTWTIVALITPVVILILMIIILIILASVKKKKAAA